MQKIKSFLIITLSTFIMAIGVYFFKFPNNFCFGGVTGAYTHEQRYIIFTTLTRKQALALRQYIHENHLHAFISMSSTSEVFGKGFSSIWWKKLIFFIDFAKESCIILSEKSETISHLYRKQRTHHMRLMFSTNKERKGVRIRWQQLI